MLYRYDLEEPLTIGGGVSQLGTTSNQPSTLPTSQTQGHPAIDTPTLPSIGFDADVLIEQEQQRQQGAQDGHLPVKVEFRSQAQRHFREQEHQPSEGDTSINGGSNNIPRESAQQQQLQDVVGGFVGMWEESEGVQGEESDAMETDTAPLEKNTGGGTKAKRQYRKSSRGS